MKAKAIKGQVNQLVHKKNNNNLCCQNKQPITQGSTKSLRCLPSLYVWICHHQWLKRNCLLLYSCQTYVNKQHTTKYVISDPCRGLYFHTPKKISLKKETVEIFCLHSRKLRKQWSNYLSKNEKTMKQLPGRTTMHLYIKTEAHI